MNHPVGMDRDPIILDWIGVWGRYRTPYGADKVGVVLSCGFNINVQKFMTLDGPIKTRSSNV